MLDLEVFGRLFRIGIGGGVLFLVLLMLFWVDGLIIKVIVLGLFGFNIC